MEAEQLIVGDAIDVLVLGQSGLSRAYYAEGELPATCWSKDSNFPHRNAPKPEASRCIDCTKSIRGSRGPTGTACRFNQRLAVVPLERPDTLYQLYLTPASIFAKGQGVDMAWQQYVRHLKTNNSDFEDVITHVYRDSHSTDHKLFFRPKRSALEEDIKCIATYSEREIIDALEFTVPTPARNPFGTVEGFTLDVSN